MADWNPPLTICVRRMASLQLSNFGKQPSNKTLQLPFALAIRHNGLIDDFPTEKASPAQDRLPKGEPS